MHNIQKLNEETPFFGFGDLRIDNKSIEAVHYDR